MGEGRRTPADLLNSDEKSPGGPGKQLRGVPGDLQGPLKAGRRRPLLLSREGGRGIGPRVKKNKTHHPPDFPTSPTSGTTLHV